MRSYLKIFFLLCAFWSYCLTTKASTWFTIERCTGIGLLPTLNVSDISDANEDVNSIYKYAAQESGLEWSYSYFGCEKRAHALALLLSSKDIKCYKIWNFDPVCMSMFNNSQQLVIPDGTGIVDKLSWRYHVAICLFVNGEKGIDTIVIDPALERNPVTVSQWLGDQNSPRSSYTILDAKWYNFVTINNYNYSGVLIPSNFPPILSGDFYLNDGISLSAHWVEDGLVLNEVGMLLINGAKKMSNVSDGQKRKFYEVITNANGLANLLQSQSIPSDLHSFSTLILECKIEYQKRLGGWITNLNRARERYNLVKSTPTAATEPSVGEGASASEDLSVPLNNQIKVMQPFTPTKQKYVPLKKSNKYR